MKVWGIIAKIVVALAAIAGIVYVVATYGDKIVAWAKKALSSCKCRCTGKKECVDADCECDCDCAEEVAEVAEETAADDVVAAEADFEG